MNFDHRSYNGDHYQLPKPEVFFDAKEKFLIVATPWGPRAPVRNAISMIAEYYLSSKGDHEITSPFERLTNLSTIANNLRVAALLANEAIYDQVNKHEYHLGLEIFIASYNQSELVWLQVGRPHVCLSRPGLALLPFSMSLDLAAELSSPTAPLPPLPSQVFGLDSNPNMFINSFRPQANDKLVLLSRHWLPDNIISLPHHERDVESISKILCAESEVPFWIGVWDLTAAPDQEAQV